MDTSPLHLGGLRIFVLVHQVLVDGEVHQLVNLGLLPRLAEGGQILTRVPIEQQFVLDGLESELGDGLLIWEVVFRERLGHVSGGKEGLCCLVQLLVNFFTLV